MSVIFQYIVEGHQFVLYEFDLSESKKYFVVDTTIDKVTEYKTLEDWISSIDIDTRTKYYEMITLKNKKLLERLVSSV